MGMSRTGDRETHGRASPQPFQRDNKHIFQKTEFGEAKFYRSGGKNKKHLADRLPTSWKVCCLWERNVLGGWSWRL